MVIILRSANIVQGVEEMELLEPIMIGDEVLCRLLGGAQGTSRFIKSFLKSASNSFF